MQKILLLLILYVFCVTAMTKLSVTRFKNKVQYINTTSEKVITKIDSSRYLLAQKNVDRLESVLSIQDSMLIDALSNLSKRDKQIIALKAKISERYDVVSVDTVYRLDTLFKDSEKLVVQKYVFSKLQPIRSKFFDVDFIPKADLTGYSMDIERRISILIKNKVKRRFFKRDEHYAEVSFPNQKISLIDAENISEVDSPFIIKPSIFAGYMLILNKSRLKSGFGVGAGVSINF
jgi:hypothetical protein